MKIEQYNFGSMRVDGQDYDKDLILTPGGVLPNWWRQEGHKLHMQDLEEIWASNPKILIIGTGKMGIMKVPSKVKKQLEERTGQLFIERTTKAVELYNELVETDSVVAAFHLTC